MAARQPRATATDQGTNMKHSITLKAFSLGFAAIVTLAIAGGLDAMATTGQSSTALLAQHGTLQTACTDTAPRHRS
jgi:hypothetical protein